MNDKYPSDKQDKFMLRLPDGMRERIALVADRNGRSMNAEIVERLEMSFPENILERLVDRRQEETAMLERMIAKSIRLADRLAAVGATADLERAQLSTQQYERELVLTQAELNRLRAELAALRAAEQKLAHKKPRARRG